MRTAMQNLHERWGLSTSEIGRALGISQRVARLAHDGTEPAEGAEQLDTFLAMLHVVDGIEEPAAWMSEPIVDGYSATRWDIYVAGRGDLLPANALGAVTGEELLHEFDPDWRRNFWTSFATYVMEDGSFATRGKTYDEVRAHLLPATTT